MPSAATRERSDAGSETSLPISRAEAEQELGHDSWPGRKGANRSRPALKTRDEFFQLIAESDSPVLGVAVKPNVRFGTPHIADSLRRVRPLDP